jgi:uncharacterized Zn-binding protein involved in type VI secretion
MPAVCRVNDQNSHKPPGRILGGVSSVIVNGRPIAVVGNKLTPHGKGKHAKSMVQKGSGSVFAGGKKVTYVGATDDCGDTHITGSGDVFVGG